VGGRTFPAYVGVEQVAKRRGRKVEVEVEEGSWHCNGHTVYCKGGCYATDGEGGWHVVVGDGEEEGGRVDEEAGIGVVMVLLVSRGFHGFVIVAGSGLEIVTWTHSDEARACLHETETDSEIVGCHHS
jgi:hypothetical protein